MASRQYDYFNSMIVDDNRPLSDVASIMMEVQSMIDEDKDADVSKGEPVCEYFFRGESRIYSAITRSICPPEVKCVLNREEALWTKERELYHKAYQINPDAFAQDATMVERLTRMQHYGLPTRFADLSQNALLSIFFACDNSKGTSGDEDNDGVLRIFKIHPDKMKRFTSDIITAIAHLPLIDPDKFVLDRKDSNEGGKVRSYYPGLEALRYEVNNERPWFSTSEEDLENRLLKEIQQVWAFKPTWNNARIRFQEGIFLAFGCGDRKRPIKASCTKDDFPMDKGKPSSGIMQLGYVKIAAKAKSTIIEQLRSYGVLAEMVYPDLSDACTAITRRTRNPPSNKKSAAPKVNAKFWSGFITYCEDEYGILINKSENETNNLNLGIQKKDSYALYCSIARRNQVSVGIKAYSEAERKKLAKKKDVISGFFYDTVKKKWDKAKGRPKANAKQIIEGITFSLSRDYTNSNSSMTTVYEDLVGMICQLIKGLQKGGFPPDTVPSSISELLNRIE